MNDGHNEVMPPLWRVVIAVCIFAVSCSMAWSAGVRGGGWISSVWLVWIWLAAIVAGTWSAYCSQDSLVLAIWFAGLCMVPFAASIVFGEWTTSSYVYPWWDMALQIVGVLVGVSIGGFLAPWFPRAWFGWRLRIQLNQTAFQRHASQVRFRLLAFLCTALLAVVGSIWVETKILSTSFIALTIIAMTLVDLVSTMFFAATVYCSLGPASNVARLVPLGLATTVILALFYLDELYFGYLFEVRELLLAIASTLILGFFALRRKGYRIAGYTNADFKRPGKTDNRTNE